jgi:hypothetical protein
MKEPPSQNFTRCGGRLVQVSGVSKDNLAQAQEHHWEPDYRRRVRRPVATCRLARQRAAYRGSGLVQYLFCGTRALLFDAVQDIENDFPCAVRLSSHNVGGGTGRDLSLAGRRNYFGFPFHDDECKIISGRNDLADVQY